jgi:hypothetical protein
MFALDKMMAEKIKSFHSAAAAAAAAATQRRSNEILFYDSSHPKLLHISNTFSTVALRVCSALSLYAWTQKQQ